MQVTRDKKRNKRSLKMSAMTALDRMYIFVDQEAKWEQMQEDFGRDDVVDAGHRVDTGKNFGFDGNLKQTYWLYVLYLLFVVEAIVLIVLVS